MKYNALIRLFILFIQVVVCIYVLKNFTFLNIVGYSIVIVALEELKERKFPKKPTK